MTSLDKGTLFLNSIFVANKLIQLKRGIKTRITELVRFPVLKMIINFYLLLFSAYDEKQVESIIADKNPAILCGFNCNLRENVGIADISIKGFAPFK